MNYILPEPKAVSGLLEMIFGDRVAVAKLEAVDANDKFVATFVNDADELVALCACDSKFVGYSGGALSMIPPDAVNEAIEAGEMTKVLSENFHEVMNICSKLLMSESSAHLRLKNTMTAEDSADVVAHFEMVSGSAFSVDVPRYGKGIIHFLVT